MSGWLHGEKNLVWVVGLVPDEPSRQQHGVCAWLHGMGSERLDASVPGEICDQASGYVGLDLLPQGTAGAKWRH